jgi:hypothetical protein
MKCSNCKLEGYNKNNCPRCKEKNEERFDRLLEILPTETVFVSIAYFSLSQTIQKRRPLLDFAGTAGDLLALKSPNAGIVLGGMLSLAYEGVTDGFDFSPINNWLERQGLTKTAFEDLFGGKSFVQI